MKNISKTRNEKEKRDGDLNRIFLDKDEIY